MKRVYFLLVSVAIILTLSCSDNKTHPVIDNPDEKESPYFISYGPGLFRFANIEINRGQAIYVYSYLPTSYNGDSQVLFVMHGNGRNAADYLDSWIDIAEEHNALLIVPHFGRENGFPNNYQYNMGNMFDMDSDENLLSPNPENEWSYSYIDPVFDYIVEKMENRSTSYLIYGHSAGSQFLHRLLFFKPKAKIKKAVCANAGWYTMPDFEQEFPYGFKETEANEQDLEQVLNKKVIVLLGDQDIDPNHESLRRTPEAMLQGTHRFERGHTFFQSCKDLAGELGYGFQWELQIVPGVAHSNSGMVPAAANVLFQDSNR